MNTDRSVAIVGAGVAGITTAYFLAKEGFKVTVFDPNGIAKQCSYANGGQISVCNSEVWNTYSNIAKGIKWMTKKDAPLYFRADHWSWDKIKWIAGFIGATVTNSYDKNTRKTIEYALRARELMKEVNDIDYHQNACGILHIYKNQKSWDKARRTLERFKDTGWGRIEVSNKFLDSYNIKDDGVIGCTFTAEDSVGDIFTFCNKLSEIMKAKYDYEIVKQKIRPYDLYALRFQFDEVVIAAGAYTPKLVPSVNLYPIKGYSVTYNSQPNIPTLSILDDDAKIVASPFSNGVFRVAGTAELAGWNHDIVNDRIKPLTNWVKQNTFIESDDYKRWSCLRPMTPNMLPIIDKINGVWVNTGAGHLGWTMGMALAEKITWKIQN